MCMIDTMDYIICNTCSLCCLSASLGERLGLYGIVYIIVDFSRLMARLRSSQNVTLFPVSYLLLHEKIQLIRL